MKKKLIMSALAVITLCGCDENNINKQTKQAQQANLEQANAAVAIPRPTYFQERRTLAKWINRWDKPNVPCYVYLVSYGKVIGYYVTDGKPASSRNYLIPEYKHNWHGQAGCCLEPEADLDGTYGDNNPGIRFFTAEGTAVEWGGQGATYIYSDAPLPLNVPKLNAKKY